MPRWSRPYRPHSLHHLIARFVNRERRLEDAAARAEYLRRLGEALQRSDWTLLGYALMGNHVHLCALAGEQASAPLLRALHGGFGGWLNRRQGRLGPVFADRYRTVVCPSQRALELLAYVHNNPVRAGVVADPADSAWTSHGAYLSRRAPPWLDVDRGLALCGLEATAAGRRAFQEETLARATRPRDPVLSGGHARALWAGARLEAGGPVELGAAELRDDGTPAHALLASPDIALRPRWGGEPAELLSLVAARTGISVARLRSRERTQAVSAARRLAVWVHSRELGRPQVEMAQLLGVAAASANNLLRRLPRGGVGPGWAEDVRLLATACRALPTGGGQKADLHRPSPLLLPADVLR